MMRRIPKTSNRSQHHRHAVQSKQPSNQFALFLALVAFRVLNSLLIQTSFVPDEYWQSIEVAHKWVFGYGSLTWEWHPQIALRSPLHPLLISVIYRLAACVHLDSRLFIIYAPRLLHALLAALTDFYLYRIVYSISGIGIAKWTLFHQLCNWFTFFCAPRTLVNCLEWCLTTISLSCYPWHLAKSVKPTTSFNQLYGFVWIAVLCVLIRPTAAVIWFPICGLHIYQLSKSYLIGSDNSTLLSVISRIRPYISALVQILINYILIVIPCLIGSLLLDRFAYGYWTCNQWNFIRFNLLSKGSEAYGVHPWHWYLSQGLPAILTSQLLFVLYALVKLPQLPYREENYDKYGKRAIDSANASLTTIAVWLSAWTIFCYSLLAHKEFRFIFPLTPLAMYLCGQSTCHLIDQAKSSLGFFNHPERRRLAIVLFTLITQVPLALYGSIIHQRGGLDTVMAMGHAFDRLERRPDQDQIRILSLMPCHSLPSVSFFHQNISFRQLNCDPNLPVLFPHSPYVDEADLFYDDPISWLMSNYNTTHSRPHYVLAFNHLTDHYPQVEKLLTNEWAYRVCEQFFFSQLLTHHRHGHRIHVYCDPSSTM